MVLSNGFQIPTTHAVYGSIELYVKLCFNTLFVMTVKYYNIIIFTVSPIPLVKKKSLQNEKDHISNKREFVYLHVSF